MNLWRWFCRHERYWDRRGGVTHLTCEHCGHSVVALPPARAK